MVPLNPGSLDLKYLACSGSLEAEMTGVGMWKKQNDLGSEEPFEITRFNHLTRPLEKLRKSRRC